MTRISPYPPHFQETILRKIARTAVCKIQHRRLISIAARNMGISNYASEDGEFRRKPSSFRNHIQANSKYAPEKGRYHLYISWACPWGKFLIESSHNLASRTLIVRELKGLQDIISMSAVHDHLGENGWRFVESEDEGEDFHPEPFYGAKYLREIYFKAQPDYGGRFTVPVLWDTKTESIVNNESRYIIWVLGLNGVVRSFECFTQNLTHFFQKERGE